MPKLNDADSVRLGSTQVDRVYLGATEVWAAPVGGGGATIGNTGSFLPDTNLTQHTASFTVGSGSNRVLVVFVPQRRSPLRTVQSMTYNGIAGTVSPLVVTDDTALASVTAYYWLEADLPAAGTYDCVVTFNNSNNVFSLLAMEFADAPQIAPSAVGDNGSSVSAVSMTGAVAAGSLAAGAMVGDTDLAAPAEPSISGEQTAGPGADFGGAENQTRSGYILSTDTDPTVAWTTPEVWTPVAGLMLTFAA